MKHPARTFLVAPGLTEGEVEEVQRMLGQADFRHIPQGGASGGTRGDLPRWQTGQ